MMHMIVGGKYKRLVIVISGTVINPDAIYDFPVDTVA